MRKNGINRTLYPIEGGVCAPDGFMANAVACGIREKGELDFGMLFSQKRCSVGCVYPTGKTVGAPVKVSKHNMRNGYARAVLLNGGIANALASDGESLALAVCDLFFSYGIERTETVIASTGELGKPLSKAPFLQGYQDLYLGLGNSDEHSQRVAQAIQNTEPCQLSFSFDLGDYPCKIGTVFTGGAARSTLVLLTTDVNISTPMLQRALETEVRDTLQQLLLGNPPSPNDTVCILANGRAGNYRIDCPDSEYKKFAYALKRVLAQVCQTLAKKERKPLFTCRVVGAKSKEVARLLARSVVGASDIKTAFQKGEFDIAPLLCLLLATVQLAHTEKLRISLCTKQREQTVYEDNRTLKPSAERLAAWLSSAQRELVIDLQEGNYQGEALGLFD